jgi:hypothetical protein
MSFATLWLPTLLSAVFVFVASSIVHMMMPWHKNDYRQVPNQDAAMDALRPLGIQPGDYMVPKPATRDEMKSPEYAERMKKGPVFVMTVFPTGPWMMGSTFAYWFIYLIFVNGLAGHVAGGALGRATDSIHVFHTVALSAFAGYSLGLWQLSIWYRRSWATTLKASFDGLIYAVITGATFVWLWPA